MIKLEKVKCDFTIVSLDDINGITLNKKKDNLKITICDNILIQELIENNFNKKYRSLLYLVMNLNESEDTTESDTSLALLKIDALRNMLLTKYFKFLNRDLLEKYLNMLILLETKIPVIEHNRGR